jgi:serine protease Do
MVFSQKQTDPKQDGLSLTSDLPKKEHNSLLLSVIALSLLFGLIGSIVGSVYILPLINNENNLIPLDQGIKTIQVNEQSAVVDVVKKASPAVVSIIVSKDLSKIPGYSFSPFEFNPFSFDPFFLERNTNNQPNIQQVGGGSGFIISSDGMIVTNKHVVNDPSATYTVLTNDGRNYPAKVLSHDPINDIALVKIEASGLPTLVLGNSDNLEIGQKVIAIGNSLGQYRNTVTTGIISGIGRTITALGAGGSEQLEGVIQTDAAINPGNSGGPLLDIGGSVIGINTAIDSQGQLVGFAIPVNDLKKDIESYTKYGRIVKPFLGVRYVLINQAIKEENNLPVDYGALLLGGGRPSAPAVVPNSAADKAGLKENDIILSIHGVKVGQEHSLAGILKQYNPGDAVKMKIFSRDSEKEVTVILGETK